jgi:hypothetical protein
MLKNLKNIHGFWFGSDLSDLELLSIKSFLYHGHKYILWSYDNPKIALDIDIRDAREIVKENILNRWFPSDIKHSKQTFANFFRYKLATKYDIWWCDLDIICLKPFVISAPYFFTSIHDVSVREELKNLQIKFNITNGCFFAPKNSNLLNSILNEIEHDAELGKFPHLFGEWGTILFTKNIVNHNLLKYHIPNWIGYGYQDAEKQYTDPSLEIPNAACVHFYNYLGKKNEGVKNSLYNKLEKKYL